MPETETTETTETEQVETTETETVAGEDALGDKGKQALDRMKVERAAAKAEAKEAKDALAALQAKIDGKEAEHTAQQAQRERDAAALAKADERIKKAEVRAIAAGKLADPADALRFIDLDTIEVSEDGEVDAAAVTAAVDDLLKSKPYLAAQGGARFQGGADGGTRKESGPAQLTKADVERLTSERKYAEIEKARQEGRLNTLLGIS